MAWAQVVGLAFYLFGRQLVLTVTPNPNFAVFGYLLVVGDLFAWLVLTPFYSYWGGTPTYRSFRWWQQFLTGAAWGTLPLLFGTKLVTVLRSMYTFVPLKGGALQEYTTAGRGWTVEYPPSSESAFEGVCALCAHISRGVPELADKLAAHQDAAASVYLQEGAAAAMALLQQKREAFMAIPPKPATPAGGWSPYVEPVIAFISGYWPVIAVASGLLVYAAYRHTGQVAVPPVPIDLGEVRWIRGFVHRCLRKLLDSMAD